MLEWYVYVGNFNSRRIEPYNIFCHWRFYEECQYALKKYGKVKEAFLEEVRGWLMYYFWSKCEWEIILNHWPPRNDKEAIKIDVYDQVRLNWDKFAEYLWENKSELKKKWEDVYEKN